MNPKSKKSNLETLNSDFAEHYKNSKSDWLELKNNILAGRVKTLSEKMRETFKDRDKLTKFLIEILSLHFISGADCHPLKFLKLTFSGDKSWTSTEKQILGEVVNAIWTESILKTENHRSGPILNTESNKSSDCKEKIISFVQKCLKLKLIDSDILEKNLSIKFIDNLHILGEKDHLKFLISRENVLKLSIQKSNLLHENSEGYSKLIEFLIDEGTPAGTKESKERILNLIGANDLAPERVADVLLDYTEENREREDLEELLRMFPKIELTHLMGLKFRHYDGISNSQRKPVPLSLLKLSTSLATKGIINIEVLYPYIQGNDTRLNDIWKAYLEKSREEINNVKLEPIQIDSTNKSLHNSPRRKFPPLHFSCPGGHMNHRTILKPKSQKSPKTPKSPKCEYCGREQDQMTHCRKCDWTICAECSQQDAKFRIYHLLRSGRNKLDAEYISKRLISDFLESHPSIQRERIRNVKDLLKKYKSKNRQFPKDQIVEILLVPTLKSVEPLLSGLRNPSFKGDKKLFGMLCRFCRDALSLLPHKTQDPKDPQAENCFKAIVRIIKLDLITPLTAFESGFVYSHNVWEVLQGLHYTVRYEIYGWWLNEGSKNNLISEWSQRVSILRCLRFRKMNLHREEKSKINSSKALLKFIHNSTICVIGDLLDNIMHRGYEVSIKYLVESFKFASELVLDAVIFSVLNVISDPSRLKFVESGSFVPVWLQNLTEFTCQFIREYPLTDFRPLVEYIALSTKVGQIGGLYPLRELLRQIGGVHCVEDMELLKEEEKNTSAPGILKNVVCERSGFFEEINSYKNFRSAIFLFALLETKGVTALMVQIAQNVKAIFWKSEIELTVNALKVLSFQHSLCVSTLAGLLEFLSINLKTEEYCSFMPQIGDLFGALGLGPAEGFSMVRKVLFSTKYFRPKVQNLTENDSEIDQKNDIVNKVRKAMTEYLKQRKTEEITADFFTLFWAGDLSSFIAQEKLQKMYSEAQDNLQKTAKSLTEKDGKELAKYLSAAEKKLQKELSSRIALKEKYDRLFGLLMDPKNCFKGKGNENVFFQNCILPRCLYSPHDSVYTAKFVFHLLEKRVEGFSYVNFCTILTELHSPIINSSTETEASNFGRFLRVFLSRSLKLCQHPRKFDRLAQENCCFAKGNGKFQTVLDFKNVFYRLNDRFFKTFARILAVNAQKDILQQGHVGITNTAHILKQISSVFPHFHNHFVEINQNARTVVELIDRPNNVKTILLSLLGVLERNRKTIRPENFSVKLRREMVEKKMENMRLKMLEKRRDRETKEESVSRKKMVEETVHKGGREVRTGRKPQEETAVVKNERKGAKEKKDERKTVERTGERIRKRSESSGPDKTGGRYKYNKEYRYKRTRNQETNK